jgi:hypothetical protein
LQGSAIGGFTRTVVGFGVENGLQYVDVRYNGTAINVFGDIFFEGPSSIASANAATWTQSVYLKLIAAPNPPLVTRFAFRQFNSGGTFLAITQSSTITTTSSLSRFDRSFTTNQATVATVQPSLHFEFTNAATYDFTIRIAAPQMELGAYATTFIPTTTAAVTRLVDTFTRSNIFTNGFITAAGGTWFLDLSSNLALTRDGSTSFFIGDNAVGTLGNSINIRNNGAAQRLNINKVVAGSLTPLYLTLTDNVKMAIKWNGTTADVFVNGSKVHTATPFTATALQFLGGTGSDVPKFINQSSLFPVPLTDAQCIQLTT